MTKRMIDDIIVKNQSQDCFFYGGVGTTTEKEDRRQRTRAVIERARERGKKGKILVYSFSNRAKS